MKRSTSQSIGSVAGVVLLTLLLGFVSAHANNLYAENEPERVISLTVEVAENPYRFSFDTAGPLLVDATPAYGNSFVTQGYIYPKNTLQHGDSGVAANGNPSYPDLVLGEFRTIEGLWHKCPLFVHHATNRQVRIPLTCVRS
jgi:hypothetical protein